MFRFTQSFICLEFITVSDIACLLQSWSIAQIQFCLYRIFLQQFFFKMYLDDIFLFLYCKNIFIFPKRRNLIMFLFITCKCHSLWTKCWGMSLTLISKLMEREGTFQRGGKIFGEISGHWFSLDLSLDISRKKRDVLNIR